MGKKKTEAMEYMSRVKDMENTKDIVETKDMKKIEDIEKEDASLPLLSLCFHSYPCLSS